DLTSGSAIKQGAAECERLHLAVNFLGVVARLGPENHATTDPQGGTDGAGAGTTSALLAPWLLATATDFTAGLGGMSALAIVGIDGNDHFLHGLKALVAFEHGKIGEILFAAGFAVGTKNCKFHVSGSCGLGFLRLPLDGTADDDVVTVGTW